MAPLMLVSVLVTSYMCYVQGPCRSLKQWMKEESIEMNRFLELERLNEIEESCQSNSQCLKITECPPLHALINRYPSTPQDLDTLRKAFCGHEGQMPKVCCPLAPEPSTPSGIQCFTPNGQIGRCVGLYSCPQIHQQLAMKPVPPGAVEFAQKSRCSGPDPYSVCCGIGEDPTPDFIPGVCNPSSALPDPRSQCCGRETSQSNRIVGGTKTTVDQYPWLTLIEYRSRGDGKVKLLCGGVLISGRYVLTAGHCIVGAVTNVGTPINVRLGEYDISNDGADCDQVEGGGLDCTEGTTIIPIERTIPHPEYDPSSGNRRHDIALIRMRQLAPYTDFIRPICLPKTDITRSAPPNLTMYVAGWGAVDLNTSSSNIKLHVDLPYKSSDVCQRAYTAFAPRLQLWSGQLCAGGEEGKDSCKGDSGGPLMSVDDDYMFEVVGIVSFGPARCGKKNVPGIYTKVFEYNQWIRSHIQP